MKNKHHNPDVEILYWPQIRRILESAKRAEPTGIQRLYRTLLLKLVQHLARNMNTAVVIICSEPTPATPTPDVYAYYVQDSVRAKLQVFMDDVTGKKEQP